MRQAKVRQSFETQIRDLLEEVGQLRESEEKLKSEMEAARIAGMKKQDHIGIDDTGARIEGKNCATIVTGNDYFAAYLTFPSKNRLAACTALAGVNELPYCLNKIAIKYIDEKISNKKFYEPNSRICF